MTSSRIEADKELESVLGSHKTRIRIVGTGGAGNNTVTRLLEVGIKDVEVIAVNTDAQDLLYSKADQKVLIGKNITNGLGAGSDPKKGEESAKENIEDIEKYLSGSDMIFITCGLGGGTGTGSAPIIAEIAKKVGALTIAVITLPFSDEGIIRWENARKGLDKLQKSVDTVIVLQNDRLLDLVPDMPLNSAFKVADEILVNAVKGITELVTEKGLVNLDFADVRTIMENGGVAMIGLGESDSENKAEEAAIKAIQNPLLDIDITGAKNALINITGGQDMTLNAAKTIMNIVSERLDPTARIIWGARLDESMNHSIRVMLIVTSLKSTRRSATEIDMVIKSTEHLVSNSREISTEKIKSKKIIQSEHTAKAKKPIKKKGNRVFSELFIDEARADLTVMQEAINGLATGNRPRNEKYLREIKNACSSLCSTGELFSFKNISEFAELMGELAENALKGEFDLSESLLTIFHEIPSSIESLITEEPDSQTKVEEIKEKLSSVLALLKNTQKQDINECPKITNNSSQNNMLDSHENEKAPDQSPSTHEQKNDFEPNDRITDESSNDSGPDNGRPDFSNVDDAVKFIKKLF
ncbi:MAG: cell division protein FtsZ [bacterium]